MQAARVSSGQRFSWLDPRPLWRSRNDRVDRVLGDPINDVRRAWMALLSPADPDLVIAHSGEEPISFMVLGDTGEGDASQWAVVPPLTAARRARPSCSSAATSSIRPAVSASIGRSSSCPRGTSRSRSTRSRGTTTGTTMAAVSCGGSAAQVMTRHRVSEDGCFARCAFLRVWRRAPDEKQRPGEGGDPHVAMRRPNQPGPYSRSTLDRSASWRSTPGSPAS
jgi:hypothetical protein